MLKVFSVVASLFLAGIFQCGGGGEAPCDRCTTAVIKDYSELDACELGFELEDGSVLFPERRVYIQAPSKKEDPIYYFEMQAGDRVKISFKESSAMSACMNGQIVFITCIANCNPTQE